MASILSRKNPAHFGCDGASEFDFADSEIKTLNSPSQGISQASSQISGYVIDRHLVVVEVQHE